MNLKDFLSNVRVWKKANAATIGAVDRFLIAIFPDRIEITDITKEQTTIFDVELTQ